MLGNDRSGGSDSFDMNDWLRSVAEETIVLDGSNTPTRRGRGRRRRPSRCGHCDEVVMKVARHGELPLDCPLCGRRLGGLDRDSDAGERSLGPPEEQR